MSQKIKIKRLPLELIQAGNRGFIYGRTGSGKSTLIRELWIERLRHVYQFCVGYTPTRDSVRMMRQMFPDECVHEEGFTKEHFKQLVDKLVEIDQTGRKHRSLFLLLDDNSWDDKATKTKEMALAMMNGRHWSLGIWTLMQYLVDMTIRQRGQQDWVFSGADVSNRDKIHAMFFSMLPLQAFYQIFDHYTKNRGFLVCHQASENLAPEHCIYHYRAKAWDSHNPSEDETFYVKYSPLLKFHQSFYLTPEERELRRQMEEPKQLLQPPDQSKEPKGKKAPEKQKQKKESIVFDFDEDDTIGGGKSSHFKTPQHQRIRPTPRNQLMLSNPGQYRLN
jgi:hypothetical protein